MRHVWKKSAIALLAACMICQCGMNIQAEEENNLNIEAYGEEDALLIIQQEEAARQAAEEEAQRAAKQAAEEEAQRAAQQAAEEEAQRAAQQAAEEEAQRAAQQAAEEEAQRAAQQAAEEEAQRAAQQAAEEEAQRAAQQAAEEEAQKAEQQKAEEEAQRAAQQAAEEEAQRAAQQKAEEEAQKAAQQKAEEEAQKAEQQKAEEEAQKAEQKKAEEAAQKADGKTSEKEAEKAEDKRREEEPAPEKTVYPIDFLPVEIKSELPDSLEAQKLTQVTIEIKNIAAEPLEKLTLKLWSDSEAYYITPWQNQQEAGEQMNLYGFDPNKEENIQRTITVSYLPSGAIIKADLILLPRKDITIEPEGLKAGILCEFGAGSTIYSRKDTWKIKEEEEPQAEEPSVEEPQAEEPSSEEPQAEEPQAEEPSAEEPSIEEPQAEEPQPEEPSAEEPSSEEPQAEEPSAEEPSIEEPQPEEPSAEEPSSEEPQEEDDLYIQEIEEPSQEEQDTDGSEDEEDEEEFITFYGAETGEEESETDEEYYDDYYYDDWGTYYYDGGDSLPDTQINTATPHVLIQSYSHKKTIHTGDAFAVEVTFLNTSQKINMESVMIKVDTSEGISLANGTNTIFVNQVDAGGTSTQRFHFLAATESKEATQKISLEIKYEYVENKERKEGSSSETITIPVKQKDRLELRDPQYDYMEAGKEGAISVSYVNKGYSQLNNMEAEITLDNADVLEKSVYVGNIESGKSGSLDFLITPLEEGDYSGTITLTYEDSSEKEIAVTIPVEFTSTMAYVEENWDAYEDYAEEELTNTQASLPLIPIAAAGAVLAGVIVLVTVRKKRKARLEQECDEDDWFSEKK